MTDAAAILRAQIAYSTDKYRLEREARRAEVRRMGHRLGWQTRGMTIAQKLDFYSIPEPNSGCLLWLGHYTTGGYGDIRIDGRQETAHRLAWIEKNGPIPRGLFACHKCDVPGCINVNHLFLGTPYENTADQVSKNRQSFGARNGKAKLTEYEVREILESVGTNVDLGRRYGVSNTTISSIRLGKTWRNIRREERDGNA